MKTRNPTKHIVMLAAENGALPGGKIGGMGDVIRELPPELAKLGHKVSIVVPAYGFLARLPGTCKLGTVRVQFAGVTETCDWLETPSGIENVSYQLLDHARFTPYGEERIYHDDPGSAPFATDASKFAFFSAAAARLVMGLERAPDVVHLHDWHPGWYAVIRQYDPACKDLQAIRTVLTIHNLALQGIRPLSQTPSSFRQWFPSLNAPIDVIGDPRYTDCVNPLASAIRLCDAITTVSPTYVEEIIVPGDASAGRHGGEGLEKLLARRYRDGALTGILNGCEYPAPTRARPGWKTLLATIRSELEQWIAADSLVDSAAWLALERLETLPGRRPPIIATSIGRVTDQKLGLFREPSGDGAPAIDGVLNALGDGVLIMLGSGDAGYEQFLRRTMARHQNFLFLKGYSDRLSESLYAAGDLFLMPSVFEPCGISQMLAMRSGQPCVVHAVGGLKDTVSTATGFPFAGDSSRQQATNLIATVKRATDLKNGRAAQWKNIRKAAARQRFSWDVSAGRYARDVYFPSEDGKP
jgi:starch synthase